MVETLGPNKWRKSEREDGLGDGPDLSDYVSSSDGSAGNR